MAPRGPARARGDSKLAITEVVRGSFGFVLEEAAGEQLVPTALKETLTQVLDAIFRVASPDEQAFADLTEGLDPRVLASLQSFFKVLDDGGATLRIVENERDVSLDRGAIELGKDRTEALEIDEDIREFVGRLYILPNTRQFELVTDNGVLRGRVSNEANVIDEIGHVREDVIGQVRTVGLRVRLVQARGRPTRSSYTLVSVSDDNEP